MITSGEVQPVPPPRQADGGGATAIDKQQKKRQASYDQRKRKRAKEAAERAGCADADELKLRVAQAIEAGDCTKPLLPNAKCVCKKCVAERKQKKDALNKKRSKAPAVPIESMNDMN